RHRRHFSRCAQVAPRLSAGTLQGAPRHALRRRRCSSRPRSRLGKIQSNLDKSAARRSFFLFAQKGMLLALLIVLAAAAPQHFSVLFENNKWTVKPGAYIFDAVATAEWEDTRELDGWTRLRLHILPHNKVQPLALFFSSATTSHSSQVSDAQKYYG